MRLPRRGPVQRVGVISHHIQLIAYAGETCRACFVDTKVVRCSHSRCHAGERVHPVQGSDVVAAGGYCHI